ncbi:MAG: hypothetical protein M1834_000426 [Cirrosporium novae-zelandiae]|nr:MAG: hypothetical protein M1834_000426 [Cirrosporium novae-zelandiae]
MGAKPSKQNHSRPPSQNGSAFATNTKPHGIQDNQNNIKVTSSYTELYDGMVGYVLNYCIANPHDWREISAKLGSLLEENRYADLHLLVGEDIFHVNRCIVCPRSAWFRDRCEELLGGAEDHVSFINTYFQTRKYVSPAAQSSPSSPMKIWLDPGEYDTNVIAAVVNFLYTLNYTDPASQPPAFSPQRDRKNSVLSQDSKNSQKTETAPPEVWAFSENQSTTISSISVPTPSTTSAGSATLSPTGDTSSGSHSNELIFHALVYLAGWRFGIESLADVAREKFENRIRSEAWKEELIPCIRVVYRHNNEAGRLKEQILKTAKNKFRILKTSPGFDELVMEFPSFAGDLLRVV